MAKVRTRLNHLLDGIFSASTHLAVLRALQDNREGMSGRAVARAAGINHQSSANAVRFLENLGLLERQGSGQSQLIRLNRENIIIQDVIVPLLKKEREILLQMYEDIRRGVQGMAVSATVFGSYARQENRPGSDLDLMVVVSDGKAKRNLESRDFSSQFRKKFGWQLSLFIFTRPEARRRARTRDPLMKSVLREGVDLISRTLKEVVA